MSILQLCWIAVTAVTIIFLIVAALSALPKMKTAFTAVIAAVFLAAGGITAFGSIAPLLPGAVAGLLPAAHAATTVRLPPAPARACRCPVTPPPGGSRSPLTTAPT